MVLALQELTSESELVMFKFIYLVHIFQLVEKIKQRISEYFLSFANRPYKQWKSYPLDEMV